MKKIFFLLFLSLLFADWVVQPSGTSVNLFDIHFVNTLIGYAVGANGVILKTTNGGENWFSLSSPLPIQLNACYFINSQIGYVCGQNGTVFKTTNGGEDWLILPTGVSYDLYDIYFVSPETGFITAENSTVLRTYNGGANFDLLSVTPIIPYVLKGISVVLGGSHAFVVGEGGAVFKTTDYGNNWTQLNANSRAYLYKTVFLNQNNGFIVSDSGYVLKTTDGGNNFLKINIVPYPLYNLSFLSSQIGYVCGYNGIVYKTTNGGENWEREPTNIIEPLYSIFFINSETGWACGANGRIIKRYLPPNISENKKEIIKKLSNRNSGKYFLPNGRVIKKEQLRKGIYFVENNKEFRKVIILK